jgi:hypothetical protein
MEPDNTNALVGVGFMMDLSPLPSDRSSSRRSMSRTRLGQ